MLGMPKHTPPTCPLQRHLGRQRLLAARSKHRPGVKHFSRLFQPRVFASNFENGCPFLCAFRKQCVFPACLTLSFWSRSSSSFLSGGVRSLRSDAVTFASRGHPERAQQTTEGRRRERRGISLCFAPKSPLPTKSSAVCHTLFSSGIRNIVDTCFLHDVCIRCNPC